VTADTGALIRIARVDITAELPKRDLTMQYVWQMKLRHILSIILQH
jgi:hypothetical protein